MGDIFLNGTQYAGGPTNVEANPVGAPTDVLNTIRIGSTVYSISGGGGGGNRGMERISNGSGNNSLIRERITIESV